MKGQPHEKPAVINAQEQRKKEKRLAEQARQAEIKRRDTSEEERLNALEEESRRANDPAKYLAELRKEINVNEKKLKNLQAEKKENVRYQGTLNYLIPDAPEISSVSSTRKDLQEELSKQQDKAQNLDVQIDHLKTLISSAEKQLQETLNKQIKTTDHFLAPEKKAIPQAAETPRPVTVAATNTRNKSFLGLIGSKAQNLASKIAKRFSEHVEIKASQSSGQTPPTAPRYSHRPGPNRG